MSDGSHVTPAGWYPDPSHTGQLRYWTGTAWGHDVQPAPPLPGEFRRPWWQQWWAIILTLVVCFPFGLVGVWQRKGTATRTKVTITANLLIFYAISLYARFHQQPVER